MVTRAEILEKRRREQAGEPLADLASTAEGARTQTAAQRQEDIAMARKGGRKAFIDFLRFGRARRATPQPGFLRSTTRGLFSSEAQEAEERKKKLGL